MFSWGSLWLIFLLQTGAALEYPELYTHAARMGSSTTIPCKFNVDVIPPARRSFMMFWHFQEKEIFRSPNALKSADPRLSIDQDRIQDGIADLSMSRVSIADGGLYICSMVQIPEKKVVKEIRLDIRAPPQITITNKTALINIESVLRCAISGFYPVDIDIKWLRDGAILDNVIMEIPQRGPDGTYSVNSSVTITPTEEDRKRTFSFRIQHESLTASFQEDFRLVFGDEERTKQNLIIIIIISVSVAVGVVILIVIITVIMLRRRRGGRGKDAETKEGRKTSLVSGVISGGRLSDKEAENQDNENQKLFSGDESGDVRGTRHSFHNTNKTSIRKQQPEPREEPNHSQMTNTKPAVHRKASDRTVSSPGDVRGTQHSIQNTNETSIRNKRPELREERNYSQMASTKPAHRKPPDRAVSSPGDVRETRESIHNTKKTSIRKPQPEPREKWNHSQTTGTKPVVRQKSSDTTVSSPGDVREKRHSFTKTPIRNHQPGPQEQPNNSQTTTTSSVIPPKSSGLAAYTPGNPSLENQSPGRHQTMPEDQKTEPSANNQEEEMYCSKGNVKNRIAMYENIK